MANAEKKLVKNRQELFDLETHLADGDGTPKKRRRQQEMARRLYIRIRTALGLPPIDPRNG